jgi:hypothetical protein
MSGHPTTTDGQAPEQTTVILGLDFDGVLHPMNDAAAGRFCRLPLLEAWLREHYGVDVVITSSWREAHPLDELRSHFAEDVRQRVVGVTPLAHRLFGPAWSRSPAEHAKARYVRQAELEAWLLEAGRDSESWLALDDDPELFEPECPNLVVCASEVGLTEERLEALGNLALPALIAQAHARLEQEVVSGKRDPRSLAVIPRSMIEGATVHFDHDAFGGPSSWDDDDPPTSKN